MHPSLLSLFFLSYKYFTTQPLLTEFFLLTLEQDITNIHIFSEYSDFICCFQYIQMKKNYLSLNIKHLLQSENIGKDAFGKLFGLNRGTIGSYIDNNSKPKLETLQKISERYKVSIDELINKDLTEKNTYYPNPVGVLERFSPDQIILYIIENPELFENLTSYKVFVSGIIRDYKLNLDSAGIMKLQRELDALMIRLER